MTSPPCRRQAGSVSLLVVVMGFVLLALVGFVYDAGRIITARRDAVATAEEAARAGAQTLSPGAVHAGQSVAVDPDAAARAVDAYLAGTPFTAVETDVSGSTVTVTVKQDLQLRVGVVVGLSVAHVSGTGTADAVRGVTGAGR